MRKFTAFVLGLCIALTIPAVAQFGGTPSLVRVDRAIGINVAPSDSVVTSEFGSPVPRGTLILRNETDNSGGIIGFINRTTGIDPERDTHYIRTRETAGNGQLAICSSLSVGAAACPVEITFTSDTAQSLNLGIASTLPVGMRGVTLLQDGTESLPAIAFTSDPDTGFYRFSESQIAYAASGVLQAAIDDTRMYLRNELHVDGAGSASDASIQSFGDANTGIYFPAADQIRIVAGGIDVLSCTSTSCTGPGAAGSAYGCYVDSAATGERCSGGITASVTGTTYTLTHNFGLANAHDLAISCTVEALADDRVMSVGTVGVNSFQVAIDDGGTGAVNSDFNCTMVRIN